VPNYREAYRALSARVMDFGAPRPLDPLSRSFLLFILYDKNFGVNFCLLHFKHIGAAPYYNSIKCGLNKLLA
jgi:hypothetical protein